MVEYRCRDATVIFFHRLSIMYANAEIKWIQKTHTFCLLLFGLFSFQRKCWIRGCKINFFPPKESVQHFFRAQPFEVSWKVLGFKSNFVCVFRFWALKSKFYDMPYFVKIPISKERAAHIKVQQVYHSSQDWFKTLRKFLWNKKWYLTATYNC